MEKTHFRFIVGALCTFWHSRKQKLKTALTEKSKQHEIVDFISYVCLAYYLRLSNVVSQFSIDRPESTELIYNCGRRGKNRMTTVLNASVSTRTTIITNFSTSFRKFYVNSRYTMYVLEHIRTKGQSTINWGIKTTNS